MLRGHLTPTISGWLFIGWLAATIVGTFFLLGFMWTALYVVGLKASFFLGYYWPRLVGVVSDEDPHLGLKP